MTPVKKFKSTRKMDTLFMLQYHFNDLLMNKNMTGCVLMLETCKKQINVN